MGAETLEQTLPQHKNIPFMILYPAKLK